MVMLSQAQLVITILCIALGTAFTRFLPVLIFSAGRRVPPFITKLQTLLPSAAIGLLVVYCFKHVNLFVGNRGLPEFAAVIFIILIHRLFKNTLLSISGGTLFYMFLVQIL